MLVKRKTRLEDLLSRYNTIEQAKFYIEHMGSDFSDYIREDSQYKKVISQAHSQLEALGKVQVVDRDFVPNFIFGDTANHFQAGQQRLTSYSVR